MGIIEAEFQISVFGTLRKCTTTNQNDLHIWGTLRTLHWRSSMKQIEQKFILIFNVS